MRTGEYSDPTHISYLFHIKSASFPQFSGIPDQVQEGWLPTYQPNFIQKGNHLQEFRVRLYVAGILPKRWLLDHHMYDEL